VSFWSNGVLANYAALGDHRVYASRAMTVATLPQLARTVRDDPAYLDVL